MARHSSSWKSQLLRYFLFHDCQLASVVSASGANSMINVPCTAVGANCQRGGNGFIMSSALERSRFGLSSFRMCHLIIRLEFYNLNVSMYLRPRHKNSRFTGRASWRKRSGRSGRRGSPASRSCIARPHVLAVWAATVRRPGRCRRTGRSFVPAVR